MESTEYQGGCHCGAVRFVVRVERHAALQCNCSICAKKGYLHLIVPKDRFELRSGREALTTYTYQTHVAQHHFCRTCGIHSFYVPRSHPDGVSVNLRCLDGDVATHFEVQPFDGANWEDHIDSIRQATS